MTAKAWMRVAKTLILAYLLAAVAGAIFSDAPAEAAIAVGIAVVLALTAAML